MLKPLTSLFKSALSPKALKRLPASATPLVLLLSTTCCAQAGTLNFYIFDNPANGNKATIKISGRIDSDRNNRGNHGCQPLTKGNFYLDSSINDGFICGVGGDGLNMLDFSFTPTTSDFPPNTSGNWITTGLMGLGNGSISGDDIFLGFTEDDSSSRLMLPSSYTSGSDLSTTIDFSQDLAAAGISGSGLIGRFTIIEGATTDAINIYLSAPPLSSGAPAPLPLLGGASAWAFARRLRRRVIGTI